MAQREHEGYGKYVILPDGARQARYIAIDPSERADKCTCGKQNCPRNRLLPFREHAASLYRLLRDRLLDDLVISNPHSWESVLFPLQIAASISDVDADTRYVEDPMVFALCEPAVDYDDARGEMASKYVAAASIFSFLWNAYEAAVAATAPKELRGLAKDGRLGERGRRLLENHSAVSSHFVGLVELIHLAIRMCEVGGRFNDRLKKVRARFSKIDLVLAAELCREFRNFLFHGEDEVPNHPDWGEVRASNARLYRFYVLGRLLLYLIQSLAWISAASDSANSEQECAAPAKHKSQDIHVALATVQFRW